MDQTVFKRKILYLCGGRSFFSFNPSRKLAEVVKCWRQLHDVLHVCGGDICPQTEEASHGNSYGAQQHHDRWYRRLRGLTPFVTSVSEWRDIKHDERLVQYLREACAEKRPDIVWERSCRLHAAGLTIARELGVPYVLEWKDNIASYRFSLYKHRARKLERFKNCEADYIVVESGVLKDALAQEGVERGKIFVAHNAVDATQFSRNETERARVRAELAIGNDVVLAGYLGSYAFYHDAPRLVLASRLIAEQRLARQVKVLMVGAGKEYPESRALAEELGVLDETLLMLPGVPKDRVPGILSALDIAVLPGSTDIICPIKVQEYMASLLPTVAPDYACNREVLQDGVTGELFAPKDAKALANKILHLANDDALRLQMGDQARQDAAKRFSWQNTWGAALARVLEDSVLRNF